MADIAPPTAAATDGITKSRPEKPDEAKFKAELAKAEKEHELKMKEYNAKKAEVDNARSNKDSPTNDRYNELVADQKAIREQQSANKSSRTTLQEKYNAAENQVKQMIQEQKNQRAKMPFKNAEEIDAQIDHLNRQVESGKMKLVDERKALDEVSKLRKQRKGFSALEDMQKRIDEKRAENAELKKTFDTQESRALNQRYEDNQKELDEIKTARDNSRKNLDTIKAEREKLNNEQKAAWAKIKDIRDTYFQNKKAYKEYEDMLWQQRRDKQKAERDAYEKEKRKRIAEETLQKASDRAYMDEIRTTESLLAFFDPSSRVSDSSKEPSKFAAEAQRTVDESGLKGLKVMKKEEEDFFVGSGGKKKGKGKKTTGDGASSTAKGGKFNLDPGTIEGLSGLGIDPPASQGEVPAVVENLREKLEFFKKDQDRKTKENIAAAQKEIERLEKEALEASTSSAQARGDSRRRDGRAKKFPAKDTGAEDDLTAESELTQEKDAAADVADDMKKVSIEDAEDAAVEA